MKLVGISFAEFRSCHLLLCVALALCFNQVSSTTNETDRLALLQFKAGISRDPFGALNSWNISIGFCQWYGITCGKKHRRVTVLDLSSKGLSGSISPHVGNLSFVRKLLLPNNNFDHEIPPQVGQLRRLRILGLHNNSLIGEIPKNISGCLDLVVLSLGNNQLSGEIPGELGSLLMLQQLNLYANKLTGSVPFSVGNLSSLEILYLTGNNLVGSIPQVLGHLTRLQFIGIGFNKLSGEIPWSLGNCTALTSLRMGGNFLHRSIPQSIKLLRDIEELDLSRNNLSDADMVAHVGDFGLAKFLDPEIAPMSSLCREGTIGYAPPDVDMAAHVGNFGSVKFLDPITTPMSSLRREGTTGYAPPEYAMRSKASREGDVYSYGILLLEIFTGLSPTYFASKGNLTLHRFVKEALPGRVLEITDRFLLQERESLLGPCSRPHWFYESDRIFQECLIDRIFQECLIELFRIGVACSNQVPGRRMSMNNVADNLCRIRKKLFGLGLHEQDEALIA